MIWRAWSVRPGWWGTQLRMSAASSCEIPAEPVGAQPALWEPGLHTACLGQRQAQRAPEGASNWQRPDSCGMNWMNLSNPLHNPHFKTQTAVFSHLLDSLSDELIRRVCVGSLVLKPTLRSAVSIFIFKSYNYKENIILFQGTQTVPYTITSNNLL